MTGLRKLAAVAAVAASIGALAAAAWGSAAGGTGGTSPTTTSSGSGSGTGGTDPNQKPEQSTTRGEVVCKKPSRRARTAQARSASGVHRITHPRWVSHTVITEYYPVPERWFAGKLIKTPGLRSKHRIDWLYSAYGVTMEGDGIGLDGKHYHVENLGQGGWVNSRGRAANFSQPLCWRAGGYWLTHDHWLTYPLQGGGWSNGVGHRYRALRGVSFAPTGSLPLRYYRSVATDPRLIPRGSRVYIRAYKRLNGNGWFVAQDTGGAIVNRHIDVYRPPPRTLSSGARYYGDERIYVVPPGQKVPSSFHG